VHSLERAFAPLAVAVIAYANERRAASRGRIVAKLTHSIREARKARGLSQEVVSKRMGMPQHAYSRMERAPNLQLTTLVRIAKALGCEIGELFPAHKRAS
jgi:ribosome-binding protein aMBF1 (putative translation factor)